jgi:hypothetical protein
VFTERFKGCISSREARAATFKNKMDTMRRFGWETTIAGEEEDPCLLGDDGEQ